MNKIRRFIRQVLTEEDILKNQKETTLEDIITNLPPKYREVLLLRYVNKLSYEQIAKHLNIPLGTTKVILSRGKQMIKQELGLETKNKKIDVSTDTKTLSGRIKRIRQELGLGQMEIAAKMDITQQSYSWLETRSFDPKLSTLYKLSKVLNVKVSFLLSFDVPINMETIKQFQN